jgi:carbon-monoxide dehydrogenase medium subunit
MIPANFAYYAPKNLDKALQLLDKYGDDCKVMAGGHSLIPVMKLRLAAPAVIVDLGKIKKLDYIKVDSGVIAIGAMTSHATIAASPKIKKNCLLLRECAEQIGDQQVRNRGTLGGSLVHADPAADWPAAMLALNAEVVLRNSSSERVVKAADFFVDLLTTDVKPGEIVTEIRLPVPAQPKAGAYVKAPQAASGFAVVGVATQLSVTDGKCSEVSLSVTGLAPKAFRASAVENALRGNALDAATISGAAAKADAEASDVMQDIHASGEYRRHLARIYAKRALQAAAARA